MPLQARDAVVIDYIRSPMGRSKNGSLRHTRAEELSAHVVNALLERNPALDPAAIDDVIWGCVMQSGEQGFNVARNMALRTAIPPSVSAQTVNRLCGSSMSAIHTASAYISAGMGDIYLVGGVEHMGHLDMNKAVNPNPAAGLSTAKASGSMGITAEYLATLKAIGREQMDQFSERSHRTAAAARDSGALAQEIAPIVGHNREGAPYLMRHDETIRDDTTLDALAQLKPVFNPKGGTVTAGNASQISDGASAMLVLSYQRACDLGLEPLAKISGCATVGVDPSIMGYGPVPATQKILADTSLSMKDIGVIELNEAFAGQALAVLKDLHLLDDVDDKVNLNGGAIALGHPFGCSGTRISGAAIRLMRDKQSEYSLATMCIGLGQGIATIFQNV